MTANPQPAPTAAQWPRYSELAGQAMAVPVPDRAGWLAALAPNDAVLRPALERFLAELDVAQAGQYLETPALLHSDGPAIRSAGQPVGPYTLLRPLGAGGMGEVWLARRTDGAYQRDVALKLPHAHLMAGRVRERFLRERDILARLAHPHIARFYDAGLAEDGQPYIALEAVEGEPITAWARSHRLGLDGRLDLFAQVTDALGHAHARLVAHRDLKPANVLVSADGVRLLDFGIAKLLHEPAEGEGDALTRAETRLATPAYAAPEQLAGGGVTAATDIYALGVLLFELLAGTTPDAVLRAGGEGLQAADCRPSAAATAAIAAETGMPLATWRRRIAGDLDAIVCKALQADPEARYASVAELAADLRRHRRSEPIRARRSTAWSRLAKGVRRRRGAVLAGVLLAASLVAGVTGVLWQSRQAQAQARRAEAVKDFLLSVYRANDPRIAADLPRGQVSAKALLDASVSRIDAAFAGDPELRIELLRTAADIYRELGEDAAFEALQARQLALVRERHGPLHDHILDDLVQRAARAAARRDTARCTALLAQADPLLTAADRDRHALRAHWWMARSVCLRDQHGSRPARIAALESARALFEQAAPAERGRVTVLMELATEASYAGRQDESVALNRQALALSLAAPGRDDAEVQTIHANTGLALQQAGDLAGAEAAFAASAAVALRTTGPASRTAWLPAAKRARTAHLAGARERGMAAFAAVLAHLPPDAGDDPDAQQVREDHAERLAAEGRAAEAIPTLEALERSYRRAPPNDFALRRLRRHLGDAYARAGRPADARRAFGDALADFEANDAPAGQAFAAMRERWGRFLLAQGDTYSARAQFEAVVQRAGNPRWSHVALAHAGLARVALATGDLPAAGTHADAADAAWAARTGFFDVRMAPYLWRVRAAVQAAAGQPQAARALREKALAASRATDAPGAPSATRLDYIDL